MRSLGKKTHFWPSQRLKKGVVNCAGLCKVAHWPNNNANPLGLSEKKCLLCRKVVIELAVRDQFFSKLILNNANSITTIPSDGDQLFGYYMFYFIEIILSRSIIWILYVLSHDVSNALFRHMTTSRQ